MNFEHKDFVAELQGKFCGEIRSDVVSRKLYSTDASIYQIEPLGVAFPKNQEDLHAIVELAAKHRVPILPRGGGSSLAGQAIGRALILDCSRWLNQLIEISPETRTATVEPGVILSRLNARAAKYNLVFGPDPASVDRATMGGVIGNNSTGAHSILYGMAADHLISADVIQADGSLETWGEVALPIREDGGPVILSAVRQIREAYKKEIVANFPQTWRNSAGYRLNYLLPWSPSEPPQWVGEIYPANLKPGTINLAALLAGSEGTLAVLRKATVNLVPLPEKTILGVVAYKSVPEACEDVPRLLEFKPSAIELIPRTLIRLAKGVPAYASQLRWVPGDPEALLVIEFSGSRPDLLREAAKSLGSNVILAESQEEQTKVWNVRKVGLGIFDSRPADRRPVAFIEDSAIPVEQLGEFVRGVDKILAEHNTRAAYYAHASAGCLHIRPLMDMKRGSGDLRSIAEATFELTVRLGGAMSSEHGDGILRAEFLKGTYGEKVSQAMRILKQAADPENLLNPEKMLDAPAMDTNLRYGEAYRVDAWVPELDFSRNNGLVGAIEQCNGQGTCRKDAGVMCPSFQATREEAYSTRGRANLLRALISSRQVGGGSANVVVEPQETISEEDVFGALDLCLACKGCKAECPSGVDMAKLKYEFQGAYYKTRPRKLRDYLFGFIGPVAKIGAVFGGLINWVIKLRIIGKPFKSILSLSEEREIMTFGRRRARRGSRVEKQDHIEKVILLRDSFTHFFEPEIEEAALEVLNACGIEVIPLPYYGAGRTLISKGFIGPARKHAARIMEVLNRLDPEGKIPILGIEPSEIYTVRDEFFDLLPGKRGEVESLAERAWLIEEYLVRSEVARDTIKLCEANMEKTNNRVKLHGHCYQKAQPPADDEKPIGQAASAELLEMAGYQVEVLESGCCGMAGAFGYEAEHYELSMQVGELSLFPEVRAAEAQGVGVSAVGTSCRAQIEDGTGVRSRHPLVLINARLNGGAIEGER